MARLKERYQKEIAPAIAKEFGIKNKMAIPRVQKIVLNMGMGEAIANAKVLDTALEELRSIAGQKGERPSTDAECRGHGGLRASVCRLEPWLPPWAASKIFR